MISSRDKMMLIIFLIVHIGANKIHTSLNSNPSDFFVEHISILHTSLDVIMYKFGDNDIRDAIIDALTRNVKVRLLMDKTENDEKNSDAEKCKDAGAKLKYWNLKEKEILHGKLVIFDETLCSIGSPNFSNDASETNMEIWMTSSDCSQFRDLFDELWSIDEHKSKRNQSV